VKTWWYAGKAIGYEFIYPRKQALELAKATSEPVLTTTKETSDLANAELARVTGSESNQAAVAVEQEPTAREVSGRAQQADVNAAQTPAQGGASASANAARDTRADERARATARTELPRTASSTPSVLMLGALALAIGLGLSRGSRARA